MGKIEPKARREIEITIRRMEKKHGVAISRRVMSGWLNNAREVAKREKRIRDLQGELAELKVK